jgi:hypothetical protein
VRSLPEAATAKRPSVLKRGGLRAPTARASVSQSRLSSGKAKLTQAERYFHCTAHQYQYYPSLVGQGLHALYGMEAEGERCIHS